MWREKEQKSNASEVVWQHVKNTKPNQTEEMYLVVIDGKVAFSMYRKDGNDEWSFNKDDVTHWAAVPAAPVAPVVLVVPVVLADE